MPVVGSDVNLLVVYSDLNIADLDAVAKLAQQVRRRHRVSPRFLSLRNLTSSAPYFQIDFLEMLEAHVVLHGRDVLATLEARPADLHWQIAHEAGRLTYIDPTGREAGTVTKIEPIQPWN